MATEVMLAFSRWFTYVMNIDMDNHICKLLQHVWDFINESGKTKHLIARSSNYPSIKSIFATQSYTSFWMWSKFLDVSQDIFTCKLVNRKLARLVHELIGKFKQFNFGQLSGLFSRLCSPSATTQSSDINSTSTFLIPNTTSTTTFVVLWNFTNRNEGTDAGIHIIGHHI